MIKPAYCRPLLLGCGVLVLAALADATAPASRASIVPTRLQATSAIYEIRSDGSGRRRVGGEGALSFALSKDGSQLAFLRYGPQAGLWIVNRDGSGERRIVAADAENPILSEFPLAWSPAGDALAFTVFDTAACAPGSRCYQTRAVIVDARDGRRVDDFAGAESLHWSPDGRRMAWACDADPDPYGEREAVCFTLNRGAPAQRVEHAILNRPLWAPGGDRIAFIYEGQGTLRVLDVRRRSIRTLADPASSIDGALTWSPDGRRLSPTQPPPVSSSRSRLAVDASARDVSAVSATLPAPSGHRAVAGLHSCDDGYGLFGRTGRARAASRARSSAGSARSTPAALRLVVPGGRPTAASSTTSRLADDIARPGLVPCSADAVEPGEHPGGA